MSAIYVMVAGLWKRLGRPDITPDPPAGGWGLSAWGTSGWGE